VRHREDSLRLGGIAWNSIAEQTAFGYRFRTPHQCRERFIDHLWEGIRRAKIDARRKTVALQQQQSDFFLQGKPVRGTREQYQIAVAWAISQRKKHKPSVKEAVQAAKAEFGIHVAANPVRLGALPNKPGRPRKDGASPRHYKPDPRLGTWYEASVIDKRGSGAKLEYKIHWEGYPSSDDTWCKAADVTPDAIKEFEAASAPKKSPSGKAT
jgi:hypothetical protein